MAMCAPLGTVGRCWLQISAPRRHLGAWGLDPEPIPFLMTSVFAQSLPEAIPISPGWVLLPWAGLWPPPWLASLAR